jgi:sugar phosphate isomerase/epimerase
MAPADVVGLTVDFSNLSFAGEKMDVAIPALKGRGYHTHVKNGYVDDKGGWHFQALDKGLTDYAKVLALLHETGYKGYLSIECLGEGAKARPVETAGRDLAILRGYMARARLEAGEGA